jgi:hypothetical protein
MTNHQITHRRVVFVGRAGAAATAAADKNPEIKQEQWRVRV